MTSDARPRPGAPEWASGPASVASDATDELCSADLWDPEEPSRAQAPEPTLFTSPDLLGPDGREPLDADAFGTSVAVDDLRLDPGPTVRVERSDEEGTGIASLELVSVEPSSAAVAPLPLPSAPPPTPRGDSPAPVARNPTVIRRQVELLLEAATEAHRSGNRREALAHVRLALDLEPDHPGARALEAELRREVETASARSGHPRTARALASARAKARAGDVLGAIEELRREALMAPDAALLNQLAAWTAAHERDLSGARQLLLRALELEPEHAAARHNLGKVEARLAAAPPDANPPKSGWWRRLRT